MTAGTWAGWSAHRRVLGSREVLLAVPGSQMPNVLSLKVNSTVSLSLFSCLSIQGLLSAYSVPGTGPRAEKKLAK